MLRRSKTTLKKLPKPPPPGKACWEAEVSRQALKTNRMLLTSFLVCKRDTKHTRRKKKSTIKNNTERNRPAEKTAPRLTGKTGMGGSTDH